MKILLLITHHQVFTNWYLFIYSVEHKGMLVTKQFLVPIDFYGRGGKKQGFPRIPKLKQESSHNQITTQNRRILCFFSTVL